VSNSTVAEGGRARQVIVVGGGPSGLVVSAELARAGVHVLLLERRESGVQSRAGTVLPRVLELLDSRDLAERFFERARRITETPFVPIHIWAGMKPVHWRHLETRFPHRLILPQNTTEELLTEYCAEVGVEFVRGATVEGLSQDADGATVTARMLDGTAREFTADYVVGADGGRSAVRKLSGIGFEGHEPTFTGIIADLAMTRPWPEVRMVVDNARGWVNAYPFSTSDEPVLRFNFVHVDSMKAGKDDPVTPEEVYRDVTEILEMDIDFGEVVWASRYTNAMRRADRFREGRVFLVGDSTRIHYPASGVGMNFCLQDAFNLGWKLAAVVQGHASESILNTYEQERRPVVEKLLENVEAQCAVQFDFSEAGIAFKRTFERDIMPLPQVNRQLALELNGLTTPYPRQPQDHPLVGTTVPDVEIQTFDGLTRIGIELRSMDFLLVDLSGQNYFSDLAFDHLPLHVVQGVPSLRPDSLRDVKAMLVRPDGYVAWATCGEVAPADAEQALGRWLQVTR
jgi:2-polyprenyl-6-methoxyphenol hydroxylase-like FAD-dependent oxidoreductase